MNRVETLPSYSNPEMIEKSKLLMSLYEKVPPPEKRTGLSSQDLNTAGHEFNHAYAAMLSGVRVIKLSVLPDGESLGRTEFAGILSPDILKVIAAAGAVAAHDGCACGYGSDVNKINLLTYHFGGMSKQEAFNMAESIILGCPINIRRRTAEMIACKGEVSEEELRTCMLVAKIEEDLKNGVINYEISNLPKLGDKDIQPEEKTKGKTIIEHLRNGDQKVIYVIGNKVEIEEIICHLCLAANGHKESCKEYKKEEYVIFSLN